MGEGFPPPDQKITITQEVFDKLDIKFEKLLAMEAKVQYFKDLFSKYEIPDQTEASFVKKQLDNADLLFSKTESINSNLPSVGSVLGLKELEITEGMIDLNLKALTDIYVDLNNIHSTYTVPDEAEPTEGGLVVTAEAGVASVVEADKSQAVVAGTTNQSGLIYRDFETSPSAQAIKAPVTPDTPVVVEKDKGANLESEPKRKKKPALHDQHVRDRLIEQLLDEGDSRDDFLTVNKEGSSHRSKKKLSDLRRDIKSAFESAGVTDSESEYFFDTIFNAQSNEIANALVMSDKNGLDQKYRNIITEAYKDIKEGAVALVLIARNREDVPGEELPLLRDVGSINEDVQTARVMFFDYKDKLESSGLYKYAEYKNTKEYRDVVAVFEAIDNFSEQDPKVQSIALERYLSALTKKIDVYIKQFPLGTPDASVLDKDAEDRAEVNKTIIELKRDQNDLLKILPEEFKKAKAELLEKHADISNQLVAKSNAETKSALIPLFVESLNNLQAEYQSWQKANKIEVKESLDEKIDKGVEDYRVFYESLPTEFKSESEALKVLDQAINKLLIARNDANQISKANVVGAFIMAVADAKTEYADWQEKQNAKNKVDTDPVPDPVSPSAAIPDTPVPAVVVSADSPKTEPPYTINPDGTIDVQATVVSPDRAYEIHRTRSLEAKELYRKKEEDFNQALKAHYDSAGFLDRLTSPKKVLGINAELPPALESIRNEYRQARALYARSLNEALSAREAREAPGKAAEDMYSSESDSTRLAFARKFILKPQEAQLKMQETKILTAGQRELRDRVIQKLAEKKWLIRAGVVTLAGVAGGLSGGTVAFALGGAFWKASRMAASAYVGAAAAKHAHDYFAPGVEKAEVKIGAIKNDIRDGEFSIDDLVASGDNKNRAEILDAIGADYAEAVIEKRAAEKKQTFATAAAAIAAGGVTGAGLQIGESRFVDSAYSSASETVRETPGTESVADNENVITPAEELVNDEANQRIAEEVLRMQKGPVIIDTMSIAQYTLQGQRLAPVILSDISFGVGAKLEAIPEAERLDVMNDIRVLSEDIYREHIPERVFEARLYESIEKKFGNAPWWQEANFTKVDVGKFPVPESAATPVTPPVTEPVESAPKSEPEVKNQEKVSATNEEAIHKVETDDTISKILIDKFGSKFAGMTDLQKGQILDKLSDKFDQDPILLKELGVGSDSIDLIRPDEKIDLAVLERELDSVLPVRFDEPVLKNGDLKVAVDSEEKPVTIKVKEPAVPVEEVATVAPKPSLADIASVKEEVADNTKSFQKVSAGADQVINRPKMLTMPSVTALNGQYLEHPAYTKLINDIYKGNAEAFDRALVNAITNMEKNTYDFTDNLFGGGYDSPYTIFNSMSLKDFDEFAKMPNEQLRYELQQNNVKYETYLLWTDLIADMKKELPHQPNTTVGDMFGRLLLEDEVDKYNIKVKVKSA